MCPVGNSKVVMIVGRRGEGELRALNSLRYDEWNVGLDLFVS